MSKQLHKAVLSPEHLGAVCEPCTDGKDYRDVIDSMLGACFDGKGNDIAIGLAANQVGHNLRLIVINYAGVFAGMINPVITKYRGGTCIAREQCLSFGKRKAYVERHKIVQLSYFDRDWKPQRLKARGLLARAIQHEMDHLDGISMFDRENLGAA